MIPIALQYLLCGIFGALVALMCKREIDKDQNLTKEELCHCVQMIVNDMDSTKDEVQVLLSEVHEFAMDEGAEFDHLSQEARDIINKVRNIL